MKKILFASLFALVLLASLFVYQWIKFHDNKLHIVFCDVGQGDGILITTPSNKQILVDAGPDSSILSCLSKHMPFWDRSIDIAILTHPHSDHFTGYYYVIDRYIIRYFATEELKNKSDGFTQLISQLEQNKISTKYVYADDKWKFSDGTTFKIEAPTREFIFGKNPDGVITNSAESASLIAYVTYGDFDVLLTGDAPVDLMEVVAERGIVNLDVLQIPHHGSSTGVDRHVIDLLQPHLAVISVGKNSYGHPTKNTLDLLSERGVKVLRTDQIGDVEIVADGKEWMNL